VMGFSFFVRVFKFTVYKALKWILLPFSFFLSLFFIIIIIIINFFFWGGAGKLF